MRAWSRRLEGLALLLLLFTLVLFVLLLLTLACEQRCAFEPHWLNWLDAEPGLVHNAFDEEMKRLCWLLCCQTTASILPSLAGLAHGPVSLVARWVCRGWKEQVDNLLLQWLNQLTVQVSAGL